MARAGALARAGSARGPAVAAPSAASMVAALFAVADTLTLIAFPWFLMGAFHSLLDLTLKAAYAAVAVAAMAYGNDRAARQGLVTDPVERRRRLLALAVLLAVTAGVLSLLTPGYASDALAVTLAAGGSGYLLGSVRAMPRRSFPFSPRLPAAASVAAVDLVAFGAVLATLGLTAAGPILVFVLLGAVYAVLALVDPAATDADEAASADPVRATAPLPRPLERFVRWGYEVFLGEAGVSRSPIISDAATLAFQVLFALAVYKIVVHMEFTALALGLLIACGAAGEWIVRGIAPYVRDDRTAALGILVGGVWTLGMFAGLAGSAFPPLEFVFWAGAAAGAAWIDICRQRLAALRPAARIAPQTPMLGAPRLVVMVFAGYLVWWISTIISKPHSINLVLTLAGLAVMGALAWTILPSSVGRGEAVRAGQRPRPAVARRVRPGARSARRPSRRTKRAR